MSHRPSHTQRVPLSEDVLELLAGQALGDLSADELGRLGRQNAGEELAELESAVGRTYLAFAGGAIGTDAERVAVTAIQAGSPERVPGDVLHRLQRLADAFVAAREAAPAPPTLRLAGESPGASTRSIGLQRSSMWLARGAVAAGLALAGLGLVLALRPGPTASAVASPAQAMRQVSAQPDAVTIPWADWSDQTVAAEVTGVTGEVVWSDEAQSGVMRLAGLPHIPGSVYQLWIIDAERGMSQRVSGAIFTADDKETWVTIEPRLEISKAAAFAVTIEQPGGTWVSDMTRRVVIAARPG